MSKRSPTPVGYIYMFVNAIPTMHLTQSTLEKKKGVSGDVLVLGMH